MLKSKFNSQQERHSRYGCGSTRFHAHNTRQIVFLEFLIKILLMFLPRTLVMFPRIRSLYWTTSQHTPSDFLVMSCSHFLINKNLKRNCSSCRTSSAPSSQFINLLSPPFSWNSSTYFQSKWPCSCTNQFELMSRVSFQDTSYYFAKNAIILYLLHFSFTTFVILSKKQSSLTGSIHSLWLMLRTVHSPTGLRGWGYLTIKSS